MTAPDDADADVVVADDPVRIVVADDDDRLRRMLVGLLDDLGFHVVADVRDGAAAIAACTRERPDVVILDHRMPGLTGADVAARLHEVLPELPVIMLTAYDGPGLQRAAQHSGVAAYLVKGCSAGEISAAIEWVTA